MLLLLKSKSRTVHHYQEEQENNDDDNIINIRNNRINKLESISLTVWRKSLIFSCKGFTVIGSDGSLVYRVDNYTGRPHRIVLMDGSGEPIFTVCRPKKLSIVNNYWLIYEGDEVGKDGINSSFKKPIFCVRKNLSIMKFTRPSVIAYVYNGVSEKKCVYVIEGSYEHRSCTVFDESRKIVFEIKKKECSRGGVSFGSEVFHLIVRPGIDSRFAMAIVLLLDQMFAP
ncbi:hypothetical protein MIMGU_mgv1a020987mg [Erythranthe guttata]|uniref:Tubby C-terminal domain-containing protein n=1 Tax=Erythranthe guttata TaxID=4155 RepID=A0A022RI26_ERYGU|nr:hypothetical protein MIMGU_mgv1a020987mg [Erythranthe guttata]